MSYGKLWPGHPKPFSDEILTSWITRVADANAIKLQRMCWDLFGNQKSPWNRDVDRSAPSWLLKAMCDHTGTKYWDAYLATLNVYRLKLFQHRRWSGAMPWIIPVKYHGMKQTARSMQYCPVCLLDDDVPYFRRHWRIGLFNFCPTHQVMLHDNCPACRSPISYYRRDFGRELWDARDLAYCWCCGFDYRQSPCHAPEFYSNEIRDIYSDVLQSLLQPRVRSARFDESFFLVLHQLIRVMTSNMNHGSLLAHISERLGIESVPLKLGHETVEVQQQCIRHHFVMMGLWLMADIRSRLKDAWASKAIQYNQMTKDMNQVPGGYGDLVQEFSDWRSTISLA